MLRFTVLALLAAVNAAPSNQNAAACTRLRSSLAANSQQAAATSYCISALSISTITSTSYATAQATAKATETSTSTKTVNASPTIATSTEYSTSVSTFTETSTAYESMSQVNVYSRCPPPNAASKRSLADLVERAAKATTTTTDVSFQTPLCNCLNLPNPTTTVTATTTQTSTTTIIKKSVITTTNTPVQTGTTTIVTSSVTTTTSVVIPTYTNSQFFLYTQGGSKWASVASNRNNQEIIIQQPSWGAYGLQLSGTNLTWNGPFIGAGGFADNNGATELVQLFYTRSSTPTNLLSCAIDYDNSCQFTCSYNNGNKLLTQNILDGNGQWTLSDGSTSAQTFTWYATWVNPSN